MTDTNVHRHDEHDHAVTVLVNRRDVTLPDDHVTGLQIKEAAQVPVSFKLFDPHGDEVADEQRIHIHNKERFTAISGQDVS
jgi:hypothetical protein